MKAMYFFSVLLLQFLLSHQQRVFLRQSLIIIFYYALLCKLAMRITWLGLKVLDIFHFLLTGPCFHSCNQSLSFVNSGENAT